MDEKKSASYDGLEIIFLYVGNKKRAKRHINAWLYLFISVFHPTRRDYIKNLASGDKK